VREEWRDAAIGAYRTRYHQVWNHSFDQLISGDYDRCLWLTGPSSYLLRWGNTRIGIDLQFRFPWIREMIEGRLTQDLGKLDAILVSHEHGDLLNPEVLKAAAKLPVKLYLPDFIDHTDYYNLGLSKEQVVWIDSGDQFTIGGLSVTVPEAPHHGTDGTGVPEIGFLIEAPLETGRRRIFFPGDVRDYHTTLYRSVGEVDTLIQHIWFGRTNALNFPCEPWLSECADFAASFNPAIVYCCHLYEIGRTVDEMWTYTHAGLFRDALVSLLPDCDISAPRLGQPYPL